MATTPKMLGYANALAGADTYETIFSNVAASGVPASTTYIINTIIIVNTTSSDITVKMRFDNSNSGADDALIRDNWVIPANSTETWDGVIVIETGDDVDIQADNVGIDWTVHGLEVT